MKKIIVLTFIIFFSIGLIIEAQEIETITYTIGRETKTVEALFIGWQKTRLFIEGEYGDEWLIVDKAFKPFNGEWGKYERYSETPFPFLTHSKMDSLEVETQKTKYGELESDGRKILLIKTTNEKNQMSWWENRKYLYNIELIYLIVKTVKE